MPVLFKTRSRALSYAIEATVGAGLGAMVTAVFAAVNALAPSSACLTVYAIGCVCFILAAVAFSIAPKRT